MMKQAGLIIVISMFLMNPVFTETVQAAEFFDGLAQDTEVSGFVVSNVYLNGADSAIGARFMHRPTGFIIDLFQIQSVPQAFFWFHTPPSSDMGEPHTLEHLVLGKGNKGRYVGSLETMWLGESTAYTSQIYTSYSFNSPGGNDVFFDLMEAKLDALLHPDFSDEEIRREVCHMGVTENTDDGNLALEEKGTVYTEMLSGFEKPWSPLFHAINLSLYGNDHPLSYVSGGLPSAIRQMRPSDLREFHTANYQLSNMGMITSIPYSITPSDFFNRTSSIIEKMGEYPGHPGINAMNIPLPDPHPADVNGDNRTSIVEYPSSNEQEPGQIVFSWPPVLELDPGEEVLLDTFLYCLSGSQTSNLYNVFVNSRTRKIDTGANRVWAYVSDNPGHAVLIGIMNVNQDFVHNEHIGTLEQFVRKEIRNVGEYADNSQELTDFNARARNYLIQQRKEIEDYLNSPPGFGLRRGGSGGWYHLLKELEKDGGFKKSLIRKNVFDRVFSEIAKPQNVWKSYISKWKLLDTRPYSAASRPSPEILRNELTEKNKRIEKFTQHLTQTYGTADTVEAIRQYRDDENAKSAAIEEKAKQIPVPGFLKNPPLTYDDQLDYSVEHLPGKIPLVSSRFDSMISSTTGIAFDLHCIPASKLIYLPILPDILTEIGVIWDDKVVEFDAMKERLKNEVLGLSGSFDVNPSTGRVELVVEGSGGNTEESMNAVKWMNACIFHSYIDQANLPRIRDVVENNLMNLRNRMKSSEESWVRYPSIGYRYQQDPLILSTYCFLTQAHFMHRLKWQLTGVASDTTADETSLLFDMIATMGSNQPKTGLLTLINQLKTVSGDDTGSPALDQYFRFLNNASQDTRDIIMEAVNDLAVILPDVPDANIGADFRYLVEQMKKDLVYNPAYVLDEINGMLDLIRHAGNTRMFVISNKPDEKLLSPCIHELVSNLGTGDNPEKQSYSDTPVILNRMRSRYPDLNSPTYVGLINENTRNGVFLNSTPLTGLNDLDDDHMLDFLAAKLYGGSGAHSLFMRTWQAGLAYSNGISSGERSGRLAYYAERCPDLAETMKFVVNELKNAPHDPRLGIYTVAQVFGVDRGALKYESRGTSMASDLVDEITPDMVKKFRKKILKLSKRSDLYDKLRERMENVYGRVLIGLGENLSTYDDSTYFIIGPDLQFESLEKYIASAEEPQPVYRIYARDYWITD